jgi:hypothetical protein
VSTARREGSGWISAWLATALLTAACSGAGSPSAGSSVPPPSGGSASRTVAHSPANSRSPSRDTPSSSRPTRSGPTKTAPPVPPCGSADLAVALVGGQPAAGSVYSKLVMTNTSDHVCSTGGFAGVSYVGHGNGTQIGAPARRISAHQVQTLLLHPGASAVAALQEANARNYPPVRCGPTPADGLRVYPPNQTAAVYIRHPTLACSKNGVDLLSLAPFHAVG